MYVFNLSKSQGQTNDENLKNVVLIDVWIRIVDRDISAGIATRYGLDGPGIATW
jgi:hypothetical protein